MESNRQSDLTPFFEPRGVAIIGSMREGQGEGYGIIFNMLQFGFTGTIYPVSRSGGEVLGFKAYSAISEVDGPVDLAVLVVPPQAVPDIVAQCGQKGVPAAIVITEGFAETDRHGAELQRHLVETARTFGVRLLGPNTQGVLNTANALMTYSYPIGTNKPPRGTAAYCSQTGLLAFGVHPIRDKAYPISKVCDLGNKCDVNEKEVVRYLADDPQTKVITMHLEDVKDGQAFVKAASEAAATKPVLVLKPGRSTAGAKAVSSHTGSLAGQDHVYESAFRQAGIVRLRTWNDFWEVPKVMALQPLPRGNRVAIITATGGAGVLLADAAFDAGLTPASFTPETLARLESLSPRMAANPVDVGPLMAVLANPFSVYDDAVPWVLADQNVDCAVIVCHTRPIIVDTFRQMIPLITKIGKPVTLFGYGVDLPEMEESARQLQALGLPTYFDLETAVKALGVAAAYTKNRCRIRAQAAASPPLDSIRSGQQGFSSGQPL